MDPSKGNKKEACSIPKCPAKKRDFKDEAKTLTKKIDATDCKCAAQLYGSTVTTANTAVKSFSRIAWESQLMANHANARLLPSRQPLCKTEQRSQSSKQKLTTTLSLQFPLRMEVRR